MIKAIRSVALVRQERQEWVRFHSSLLKEALWKGNIDLAETLLKTWRKETKAGNKMPALTAAISYLKNQRSWIGDYDAWKKQGYPIGSGIIERAVAIVINRRMKRRGMSWLRGNASSVVALRVALLNDDWFHEPKTRWFP